MLTLPRLKKLIVSQAQPTRAKINARFFKTGKGEYGEGDIFIGLTVPQCRQLALQFKELTLTEIKKLLASKIHEQRLIALLLLVERFKIGTLKDQTAIYTLYLQQTRYINNWDLVDLSADKIIGEYVINKNRGVLKNLALSKNLWERRIAVIATFAFIKRGEYKPTLALAKLLLNDEHDLIQKAVGWMLREVGKRCSRSELISFLDQYASTMPRTMLRYAIEHFSGPERQKFLKK